MALRLLVVAKRTTASDDHDDSLSVRIRRPGGRIKRPRIPWLGKQGRVQQSGRMPERHRASWPEA